MSFKSKKYLAAEQKVDTAVSVSAGEAIKKVIDLAFVILEFENH